MVLYRCNTTQAKYNPPSIVPRVSCNPPSAQESTNMRSLHQSGPKGQIDKWISLSQFILSLFEGVGKLWPETWGDSTGIVLLPRPGRGPAEGQGCERPVAHLHSSTNQSRKSPRGRPGSRDVYEQLLLSTNQLASISCRKVNEFF